MNKRKIASRQDKRVSEETGWKIELNSGATAGRKGDLKTTNTPYTLLCETKSPEEPRKSFKLEEAWFEKLNEQAFSMGKDFHVLVFTFDQLKQYAALPLKSFTTLFDMVNQLQTRVDELENKLIGGTPNDN